MPKNDGRAPLSRDRVLAEAVALVDAEGIQALTMRRLAARLGVEAMSLYHHLHGKEALLDGVVEAVVAELLAAVAQQVDVQQVDAQGADWRVTLRRRFLAARRVMLHHPWMPALLGSRRAVPSGLYVYYDQIIGTLTGAGFTNRLAHRAIHAFGSLPLGFAQEVFSPGPPGSPDDEGAGLDDAASADLAAMAESLPHLTAMVASEIHEASDATLGWCDSQTEFEFTLDLVLDGLERLRPACRTSQPG